MTMYVYVVENSVIIYFWLPRCTIYPEHGIIILEKAERGKRR
jgi:hypothetical protein